MQITSNDMLRYIISRIVQTTTLIHYMQAPYPECFNAGKKRGVLAVLYTIFYHPKQKSRVIFIGSKSEIIAHNVPAVMHWFFFAPVLKYSNFLTKFECKNID
jgi:hypothetical protein